jgi:hypothetical protein
LRAHDGPGQFFEKKGIPGKAHAHTPEMTIKNPIFWSLNFSGREQDGAPHSHQKKKKFK